MTISDQQLVPEKLKEARILMGFKTRKAFAEALGVSTRAVDSWEEGWSRIPRWLPVALLGMRVSEDFRGVFSLNLGLDRQADGSAVIDEPAVETTVESTQKYKTAEISIFLAISEDYLVHSIWAGTLRASWKGERRFEVDLPDIEDFSSVTLRTPEGIMQKLVYRLLILADVDNFSHYALPKLSDIVESQQELFAILLDIAYPVPGLTAEFGEDKINAIYNWIYDQLRAPSRLLLYSQPESYIGLKNAVDMVTIDKLTTQKMAGSLAQRLLDKKISELSDETEFEQNSTTMIDALVTNVDLNLAFHQLARTCLPRAELFNLLTVLSHPAPGALAPFIHLFDLKIVQDLLNFHVFTAFWRALDAQSQVLSGADLKLSREVAGQRLAGLLAKKVMDYLAC